MRVLVAVLIAICALLQYRLWFSNGGMQEVWSLRKEIQTQRQENNRLQERNRALMAEVQDLKKGTSAIEERARTDLGMVANGETFYQVIDPGNALRPPADESADAKPAAVGR